MKVIIWGAGNIGKTVAGSLSSDWDVLCFVDRDERKIGKTLCGKEIKSLDALHNLHFDAVIVANTQGKNIRKFVHEHYPHTQVIDFLFEGIFDSRIGMLHLLIEEIETNCIDGAVAEAGVFKGCFTHYINKGFKDRKLFLFDTFEGFDERDVLHDKQSSLTETDSHLFDETSIEEVSKKLLYPHKVVFKKGYFPDTTKDIPHERYCFASIDFDLYTPTQQAISYFYANLSKGGYIMIHDYNNEDFKGVKKAVHELKQELGFSYVPIPDGGGSIIIGK